MRIFKIVARWRTSWEKKTYPNSKNHNKISKKRVYVWLDKFNKFCISPKKKEEWTLYRYNDIYDNVQCYELVNDKWIWIYPKLWKEYTADIAVASRVW